LFPASLPPGLPQNPNVLLIRTHPNPSPSVANRNDRSALFWPSSRALYPLLNHWVRDV
jgi:hypothetical protein